MIRFVLIGFLTFSIVGLLLPLPTYAISLDDDEEDAEDVADLLEQAKKAAKSESFDKAKELLKKAKLYGTNSDDIKQTQKYVKAKKEARDKRLEKQRKEKERLARLKRERERRASLASQSGSSYSGAITMCYPSIPKPIDYSKCSGARTASGKYATVQLSRGSKSVIDGKANCFDLSIYANGSYGNGNTCGGVNGYWSVRANGQNGSINGLGNAIAWLLKRM